MDNTHFQKVLDHITHSLEKFATDVAQSSQEKLAEEFSSKLQLQSQPDFDKLATIVGDAGSNTSSWQIFTDTCPDPHSWVTTFESIAQYKDCDAKKRLLAFKMLLRQGAASWFASIEPELAQQANKSDEEIWIWVKEKFLQRFDKTNSWLSEHLIHFISQQPGQSVQDFYTIIQTKTARLEKSPQEMLSLFIKGLRPDIKMFCLARQPKDLTEALSLAQNCEALNQIAQVSNESTPMQCWKSPGEISAPSTQSKALAPVTSLLREIQSIENEIKSMKDKPQPNFNQFNRNRPRIVCNYCKLLGHRASECRKRLNSLRGPRFPYGTGLPPGSAAPGRYRSTPYGRNVNNYRGNYSPQSYNNGPGYQNNPGPSRRAQSGRNPPYQRPNGYNPYRSEN